VICDPAPCVDLGPEAVGGSRSLGQLSIPHTAGGSSDGRKPTVTLLAAGRRRPPLALLRTVGNRPSRSWPQGAGDRLWRLALEKAMRGGTRSGHGGGFCASPCPASSGRGTVYFAPSLTLLPGPIGGTLRRHLGLSALQAPDLTIKRKAKKTPPQRRAEVLRDDAVG